jgi:hypothetical protein
MKKLLAVCLFVGLSGVSVLHAQRMMGIVPKRPIICYADPVNRNTVIAPPDQFLRKRLAGAKTKTATIEVEYVGFDARSRAAFQYAVDIWEDLIESPVPIRIRAFWQPLDGGTLGSAIWANAFANFDNAQKLNTFYPVALAEKMAGRQLNHPDSVDIFANFNSNASWYFETSGDPPVGTHDLVSVVLHEIGHGLGFVDAYNFENGQGSVGIGGSGVPFVFDLAIENGTGQNLFTSFTSPSAALGTQLTSNNLFFNSPIASSRPKLFAPGTFSGGSSIAHLDENTYRPRDINSLMTPQIGFQEVMHDPGPLVLDMFSDMGWVLPRQVHTPRNTESTSPLNLTVKIQADANNGYAYQPASVKLTYAKKSNPADVEVIGTPTANANEFSFVIPNTGVADTLFYFLSVTDNETPNRTFTVPGKTNRPPVQQGRYVLGIGPDTQAPRITHVPRLFLLASAPSLSLSATIEDNIGIQQASVEYAINGVTQPPVAMVQDAATEENTDGFEALFRAGYRASLSFSPGTLNDGDVITYRIKATDNSANSNVGFGPLTGTYQVNVVALSPTQDSYTNNFNVTTNDFFGDPEFSIITPAGFVDGAIHTAHPYPNGSGPDNQSNFVYQLRVPIRLKAADATLKFDEIVLVEPGEPGSVFGSAEFFDYAVVEASKDGGATWRVLADGYDARAQAAWLARYNSSNDGANPPNSTATGIPSLYFTRTINMLANGNFVAGDEVVIRFRLFVDELVHGWGWAIDNLKIQIDETPPRVLHTHLDFLPANTLSVPLPFRVEDASGVASVEVDYTVNNANVTTSSFPVNPGGEYSFLLDLVGISAGDVLKYRIRATDNAGNQAALPSTDFLRVPLLALGSPLNQYVSDFNTTNTDFVGNFFSVSQPSGFSNGAIHSAHPYPVGFSTAANNASNFTFMLTQPITVSAANPNMVFDEVAIVEFNVASNTPKDFVVVEASKNNGNTWQELLPRYAANANSAWRSAATGSSSLYRPRLVNITQNNQFAAGDNILIRFRLNSDNATNAWGWAIDNLSIQGPITSIAEEPLEIAYSPNPVMEGLLTIELPANLGEGHIRFVNTQGQRISETAIQVGASGTSLQQDVRQWPTGLYVMQVSAGDRLITKKILVKN